MDELKFYDYPIDVTAWLEIEGDIFPIIGFQARFGMNSIPEAIVQLAVGKLISPMPKESESSNIPKPPEGIDPTTTLKTVAYNKKAIIWMKMKGDYSADTPWPDKAFPIFIGYTNGIGFVRNFDQVGMTLSIVHWLIDLDRSCAASDLLTASSGSALLTAAKVSLGYDVSVEANKTTVDATNGAFLVPENQKTTDDVWDAVKNIFIQLARGMAMGRSSTTPDVISGYGKAMAGMPVPLSNLGNKQISNGAALGVLDKGVDFGHGIIVKFDLESEIKTMVAKLTGTGRDNEIGKCIAAWMSKEISEIINNASIWDVLISFCSSFRLALIPGVKTATVVPHMNRCADYLKRGSGNFTIKADEYSFSTLNPIAMDRVICGVILYGGEQNIFGFEGAQGIILGNDGFYPGKDIVRDPKDNLGHWQVVRTPGWLTADALQFDLSLIPGTPPAEQQQQQQGSQECPTAQNPEPANNPAQNPIVPAQAALRSIASRWAESVYFETKYEARRGGVTGRFRTDICPGSQVRIELSKTRFDSQEEAWIQGCVEEVVIIVDAQNRNASTGFTIKNYRSSFEEEGASEKSPNIHPLYLNEAWVGSCLIKILDQDL